MVPLHLDYIIWKTRKPIDLNSHECLYQEAPAINIYKC